MLNQRVRSYDFEPREGVGERYVEGTVTDMKDGTITIAVDVDTAFPDNPRPEVFTALPGHMIFGDWEGRLTVIQ